VLHRFGIGWLCALLGFALLGAVLAGFAIAHAQYPMLGFAERAALIAQWAAIAAQSGAVAGVAVGIAAALAARWRPLAIGITATAVLSAASIATRGNDATAPPLPSRAPEVLAVPTAVVPVRTRVNLVLITIDTLRADHLDLYGYERETAPNLRDFAAGGAVFETAISQAPMTQLAMASLLTGLWPWSHAGATQRPAGAPYLRSGFATLAERLDAGGYATAGFVANAGLRAGEGYAQGFQIWDDAPSVTGSAAIETVVEPALRWLATAPEPFFLWVHAMDPHHPYASPGTAPWEDASDPDYARLRAEWNARLPSDQTTRLMAIGRETSIDATELAYLMGRYDADIRHVDAGLAPLFAALRARGADDTDTLVVITSDHGEEFLDHGRMLHSHTLLDELLHVPLVVRGPGVPAALRIPEQVRTIDVAATLLEAAGVPAGDIDGRSLAPFWREPGRVAARPALSARHGMTVAYRADGKKLQVPLEPFPETRPLARGLAGLHWMARVAFDRRLAKFGVGIWSTRDEPRDAREAAPDPAALQQAYAALDALRRSEMPRSVPFDAPLALDAAAIEQLRALGYTE
jgi:arylsulfatase